MTEQLSATAETNKEIDALIEKLEGVVDVILDIMEDDFDEYDEEDLIETIDVFTSNLKKIDEFLPYVGSGHDLYEYRKVIQGHAANLIQKLAQREYFALSGELSELVDKPIGTISVEQRESMIQAYLPANIENNEVSDVEEFCGKLAERVNCDVKFTEKVSKNGRYEISIGEIGKLYIPKNPDPVKASGAGHTPEAYEGDSDPYLFQLVLGDKTENFYLKDGYLDQGSTLPSIVLRINRALE